jgi:FkbM family methyltransferase
MDPNRPLHRRVWGALQRPEYICRPGQVYRRLRRNRLLTHDAVTLAWGLPISPDPSCYVGRDIINLGVFDKVVPEAICRLLDSGESAVDAGAHIGQNTSMMAVAAGPSGQVHSVEPHPTIWPILSRNIERWRPYRLAEIVMHPVALGAMSGTASLHEPDEFRCNSGCSSLIASRGAGVVHTVRVVTLDEMVGRDTRVRVLKLDVEGYELEVLQGAERLLKSTDLRDILFEDYAEPPSSLRRFLEAAGFAVFALKASLTGPIVHRTGSGLEENGTANFLASLDPVRTVERFRSRGWRCLRPLVRSGGRGLVSV